MNNVVNETTIKVTITSEDLIKSPGYLSHTECPLALALKRQFSNQCIKVYGGFVTIENKSYRIIDVNKTWISSIMYNAQKRIRDGDIVEIPLLLEFDTIYEEFEHAD